MTKPPFFQFYTSDFVGGVLLFSNEEVGIYVRLLCFEWENRRVPTDLGLVVKITGSTEDKFSPVLRLKFKIDQDGYYNERMEAERIKQLNPDPTANAPHGKLPRTVEEALAFANGSGVPLPFIKEVFLEHEGTAWMFAGKPVTNFRSYISSRWMRERSFQAQRTANTTAPRRPRYEEPVKRRFPEGVPLPAWKTLLDETKRLLANPEANRPRLRELADLLPREGWGMLEKLTEFNTLNQIRKGGL